MTANSGVPLLPKDLGIRLLSGLLIKSMSNPAVVLMHIKTYSNAGDKPVLL